MKNFVYELKNKKNKLKKNVRKKFLYLNLKLISKFHQLNLIK